MKRAAAWKKDEGSVRGTWKSVKEPTDDTGGTGMSRSSYFDPEAGENGGWVSVPYVEPEPAP